MNPEHIEPDVIVGELITQHPQAAQVFLAHRMACVGCDLSGFETLADAAQVYGVPLGSLLNEIKLAVSASAAAMEYPEGRADRAGQEMESKNVTQ